MVERSDGTPILDLLVSRISHESQASNLRVVREYWLSNKWEVKVAVLYIGQVIFLRV